MEVPFAGFVPEEDHGKVDAHTAKGGGEEEYDALRRTVEVAGDCGLPFIVRYHEEGEEIDNCENANDYQIFTHS